MPPATDEPGRAQAEATDTVPTEAAAPANDSVRVGTNPSGHCGEDDIACHETMYQLEETLFQYESAVGTAMGEAAQSCWNGDVAAFRRSLDDCDDPTCRHARLRERLGSLSDLQPPG